MPAPVFVQRAGTGWTVDVTSLVLSTNLGYKDFLVKVGGVVADLADFTKTNPTLITYVGVTSLPIATSVLVFRDSQRTIDDVTFADVNSSTALNTKFTQVERVLEDVRQMAVQ